MFGVYVGYDAPLTVLALMLYCPVFAHDSPCQALNNTYSRNNDGSPRPDREMSVYGRARTLVVAHDARAPSRAAAALQLAALRALARYRSVQLQGPVRDMCELAAATQVDCGYYDTIDEAYDKVTLAPALTWGEETCMPFEACGERREVQPRLAVAGGGAAPLTLRLHAHLVPAARALYACVDAQLWDFYRNRNHFYHCGFIRDKTISTPVSVFILSNATDIHFELNERIATANLHLKLTPLHEYPNPRNELFRLVRERNSSFLFLDYDIWEDTPGVYKVQLPPPVNGSQLVALNPIRSIRLADDFLLRPLAPQALQVLYRFSPSPITIREVLEYEAARPDLGIVEAACTWAIEHKDTFESWYQMDYQPKHSIAVFLCKNDPDNDKYERIAQAVENTYSLDSELKIGIYFVKIDCSDDAELGNELIKTSMSYSWQRLIGVVAAGAGARAASELAPGIQTAVALYDMPAARVRLGDATRATSGTLDQLVAAVQYFLSLFKWTRVVVLSDDTELARDLYEVFHNNHRLVVYNGLTSGNISDTLQHLESLNARIFFVNTVPDEAYNILCAAHTLGMTNSEKYTWILREWRQVVMECSGSRPNISHFTISFFWRGGNYTQYLSQIDAQEEDNMLHRTLDELWPGETWPLYAAPLADSLELLIKSFKEFTKLHPERYFDLHGDGSVRLLLESLIHRKTKGVIQTLDYLNGSLFQPLIFIDRWTGVEREPLFVWHIQNDKIQHYSNYTRINDIYGNTYPTDGSQWCLTRTSSELFFPPCYDYVWFLALCLIVVTTLVLYVSRKIRLKRLANRDALLKAQLMAQREFVSGELVDHHVDRAALELYDYLSQGCFGRVRYAILRAPDRQPISVAVKELRDDVPLTEESELLREACTLATLYHDHVVRLIGVCATGGPLLVLMEYAFFGNLCEYLCERRHLSEGDENDEAYHVSAASLTRLGKEAASALAYLAVQRLVHRDIRASNCLIDARRSLKLANFGMARKTGTGVAGEEEYLTRRRGLFPVLWMAPESLERGVFSAATDAWGMGVLLLELATLGARPYGTWTPLRVLRYVSAGGRPPLPNDMSESTRQILVQCWLRAPEHRLTAAALSALLDADPEALKPALLPVETPADEDCPAINEDMIMISA